MSLSAARPIAARPIPRIALTWLLVAQVLVILPHLLHLKKQISCNLGLQRKAHRRKHLMLYPREGHRGRASGTQSEATLAAGCGPHGMGYG